jgi:hypothetical protein
MTTVIRLATALAIGGALFTAGCSPKTATQEAAGDVAAAAPAAATSTLSGALSAAGPLLGSLTKSIPGLSQAQAILGSGSLFGLAKAKMPADQFSQLATAVPGTQALVDEATKAGLPASNMLTGLSSLTPLLSKAGISPETVNQLIPALGSAISSSGGQQLANSFLAAVK